MLNRRRRFALLETFRLVQAAKVTRNVAAAVRWRDARYAAQLDRDVHRPTVAKAWLHFWIAFPDRIRGPGPGAGPPPT